MPSRPVPSRTCGRWPVSAWCSAVIELPSAEDLDRALGGLPIIREMGAGVKTEALPIYEYTTFAADLNEGVHGGA